MKNAVFLGDSITMGYGLKDPSDRFSSVFCRMAGFRELNYGICGTLMARAGQSKHNGTSYVDRYGTLPDGDLLVVFGGTNDYFWSDEPVYPEGPDDDRYFSCAVRTLCTGLKKKYPGKPILFILPYRMRGIGNHRNGADAAASAFHPSYETNYVGCTLSDYVQIQCRICTEERIPFLNLHEDSEIDISRKEQDYRDFTLDGCHPNEKGHLRIAEKLYRFCCEQNVCN